MDTRTLGYVGLGVLVGIVLATLIGVPPIFWIAAALIALVVGVAVVTARSNGTDDAARMLARDNATTKPVKETSPPAPVSSPDVDVELVREAGDGEPAVWLHRSGGRRVHRFETADGWVVQQVSTKDPDNPRKRVIGEPLNAASENEAVRLADDLVHGVRPNAQRPAGLDGHTLVAKTFA